MQGPIPPAGLLKPLNKATIKEQYQGLSFLSQCSYNDNFLHGCRKELIGIILVKELILVDKEANTRVGDLKMRSAPQLRADTRLYDMLRLFETGRCHMAVLVQPPGQSTPRTSAGQSALCVLLQALHEYQTKVTLPIGACKCSYNIPKI